MQERCFDVAHLGRVELLTDRAKYRLRYFVDIDLVTADLAAMRDFLCGARAGIESVGGQRRHLREHYGNVGEKRGNKVGRNSGGQAGGRDARYFEAFQSVFPRTVDAP
jgi:hypothetical protein